MEDLTKYDLTEEEYNRCLKTAEMAIFMNAKGLKNPTSIFVVAQPGAGKTSLKAYVINQAQDRGDLGKYIEFNPDVISSYHLHYLDVIKEHPDESHKILQKFTQRALDTYLRQRAVEIRCNIVQEGTFRSDGYIDILNYQKHGGKIHKFDDKQNAFKDVEGGYNIEINVLAVNRYESLLSCFEREQYFIENDLPPRPVTIENHDDSYEKMLKTIDIIERRKLFDTIKVFKRGYRENTPELIYISGDKRYPSISEAIRMERNKQEKELFNNPEVYLRRIKELRERVKVNNNEYLLNRIELLEKDFLYNLEKNKKSKEIL